MGTFWYRRSSSFVGESTANNTSESTFVRSLEDLYGAKVTLYVPEAIKVQLPQPVPASVPADITRFAATHHWMPCSEPDFALFEVSDVERLISDVDPTASAPISNRPGQIAVEVGQIFVNTTAVMEQHLREPMTPIGLPDIADEDTLMAVFHNGLGDLLARHLATEANRLLRQRYPRVFPSRVNFAFLDTFDPAAHFRLPDTMFNFGPLKITRQIMRDHLDPTHTPLDDYGVTELTIVEASGIILGCLYAFAAISNGCLSTK
ncbi:hypothetical protein [Gordonia sp. CPCC 205333]|uniref:hypothetical protein n=1 Tax=Gordonia sp. CPCC 205333 TaxID=3140790 RepID=UPI003AF36DB7